MYTDVHVDVYEDFTVIYCGDMDKDIWGFGFKVLKSWGGYINMARTPKP